jgi:hypothetical protein
VEEKGGDFFMNTALASGELSRLGTISAAKTAYQANPDNM